jgi:hypothetical protein
MRLNSLVVRLALSFAALAMIAVGVQAQGSAQSLGTVRIPAGVTANGQALPAGSYSVRLSSDPVSPVVGQSPESAKWVEFLQAGQVKGRELATVVAPADVKAVAKAASPAAGRPVVQLLKGTDYVRISVNQGGTLYLVHLARKTN